MARLIGGLLGLIVLWGFAFAPLMPPSVPNPEPLLQAPEPVSLTPAPLAPSLTIETKRTLESLLSRA